MPRSIVNTQNIKTVLMGKRLFFIILSIAKNVPATNTEVPIMAWNTVTRIGRFVK
ncbi:MAG TPA: hypothetical protein VIO58_14495 [Candidatus Methanoperedens sp.]